MKHLAEYEEAHKLYKELRTDARAATHHVPKREIQALARTPDNSFDLSRLPELPARVLRDAVRGKWNRPKQLGK